MVTNPAKFPWSLLKPPPAYSAGLHGDSPRQKGSVADSSFAAAVRFALLYSILWGWRVRGFVCMYECGGGVGGARVCVYV